MALPRFKIGAKILAAMLVLALLGFLAACYFGLRLGSYMERAAMEGVDTLGKAAIGDSKSALVAQSRDTLLAIAKDQSYITNQMLERVASQVKSAARFYQLADPGEAKGLSQLIISQEEGRTPEDITAFSAFSLAPGVTPDSVKGDLRKLSQLHDIFNFMRYNTPQITLLYIGTESGVIFKHPWMLTPTNYDHRKRAWYKETIKSDAIQWSEPYVSASANELVITCSMTIFDNSGAKVGVAAADLEVEALTRDFIRIQSERSGSAFLLDHMGRVMAKEGMSKISLLWDQQFKTENMLESESKDVRDLAAKMVAGDSGTARLAIDGNASYVGFAPIPVCRWSIAVVTPEDEILSSALATEKRIEKESAKVGKSVKDLLGEGFRAFAIASALLLLLVIIPVAMTVSTRITKPILKLKAGAERIGAGELDGGFDIKTGDEIEELASTFDKMAKDLKDYIRNLKETTAAKQRIESDLKVATEIQMSMLPRSFPPFPDRKELDIFATMEPAKEVGGDLYDFLFIDKDKLFVCVGDVSGKGVPAALFMAIAKTLMNGLALQGLPPDEIMLVANNYMTEGNDACMFITVFCGILDTSTGTLLCCDAGHNPPAVLRRGESGLEFLKLPKGLPLGTFPLSKGAYKCQELKLEPGDILFAYTDGVTEAMNASNELFGDARLAGALELAGAGSSVQGAVEAVRAAVRVHAAGEPQSDDMTMLALKYLGGRRPSA